ncbi:unnamed protein product [Pleuronectes platessa]|uniref:Uncharacterized protein n=1 Tax=Pleuronectes platessa TaxID=8262 RepID=A0A9N7Y6J0_PLEPL|nr:unnamed protein product [Pleuronectes platessa]
MVAAPATVLPTAPGELRAKHFVRLSTLRTENSHIQRWTELPWANFTPEGRAARQLSAPGWVQPPSSAVRWTRNIQSHRRGRDICDDAFAVFGACVDPEAEPTHHGDEAAARCVSPRRSAFTRWHEAQPTQTALECFYARRPRAFLSCRPPPRDPHVRWEALETPEWKARKARGCVHGNCCD